MSDVVVDGRHTTGRPYRLPSTSSEPSGTGVLESIVTEHVRSEHRPHALHLLYCRMACGRPRNSPVRALYVSSPNG